MATSLALDQVHHDYTKYEDIPFISDGAFAMISNGRVERVRRVGSVDATLYARKTIRIDKPDKDAIIQEAKILHRARHRHVVKIIRTFSYEQEDDILFSIVMEYADGNLNTYILARSNRNKVNNLPRWFGCLVGVVAYIHGIGIRHRDIKPTNILIKDEQVLLADFGISKMVLGRTMSTTIPAHPRERTVGYCAPEVEHGGTRGRSADIFSLGAVFLEMLIGYSYGDKRSDLDGVLNSRGGRSYAKTTDLVYQFMDDIQGSSPEKWFLKVLSYCRRMLDVEPDLRPMADELDSAWSSFLPSDDPLVPCKCHGVAFATKNDEMVEQCKKGLLKEVQILLANGTDSNTIGAIHQASARGFARIVQLFLDFNVDVNLQDYSNQTALHCAAGYGYQEIVGMLLGKEANVRLTNCEGETALHCAAGQGHQGIVEMLLSKGADIQVTDLEGRTALHFAARRGHDEVVRTLLDAKTDAKIKDSKGRTALHFAAGYGSEEVVGRLLKLISKSTVDAQDKDRRTALHFAARGKHVGGKYKEVRKLLEDAEADLTLKDIAGYTASWYDRHTSWED